MIKNEKVVSYFQDKRFQDDVVQKKLKQTYDRYHLRMLILVMNDKIPTLESHMVFDVLCVLMALVHLGLTVFAFLGWMFLWWWRLYS